MSVVVAIRERRRATRAEVSLPACLTETASAGAYAGDEEMFEPAFGRVLNLSTGGALVDAQVAACPGHKVELTVETPTGRMRLKGRVLRTHPHPTGLSGLVVVRFARVSGEQRRRLERLVRSLAPPPALN